jgi:hypothetical protein
MKVSPLEMLLTPFETILHDLEFMDLEHTYGQPLESDTIKA